MSKWTPLGLGGFGNMTTPAISSLVENDAGRAAAILVNCDMGAAYLSRNLGRTWRILHYGQLQGNTGIRPAFSPAFGRPDGKRGQLGTPSFSFGRRLSSDAIAKSIGGAGLANGCPTTANTAAIEVLPSHA